MKRINLMPLHLKTGQKKIEFILFFCVVLFLNCLLIGLIHISIFFQIKKLNFDKSQLLNQLSMVSLAIGKLQKIKKQSNQFQAAKQALIINHDQIRKILALIEAMQVLQPPDFFIKTISYNMSYVLIAGVTTTERSLLELIQKLENKYRSNCKYNYKKNKQQLFEFILSVSLNR